MSPSPPHRGGEGKRERRFIFLRQRGWNFSGTTGDLVWTPRPKVWIPTRLTSSRRSVIPSFMPSKFFHSLVNIFGSCYSFRSDLPMPPNRARPTSSFSCRMMSDTASMVFKETRRFPRRTSIPLPKTAFGLPRATFPALTAVPPGRACSPAVTKLDSVTSSTVPALHSACRSAKKPWPTVSKRLDMPPLRSANGTSAVHRNFSR